VTALANRLGEWRPTVLLTLGSGLGALADEVSPVATVGFAEAGLPAPTVPGHGGRLVAGDLHGVPTLVQQGRLHLYEGRTAAEVVACVEAAARLGAEVYVVTNAAGGIDPDLAPGDLLAIRDHLNLTGTSPLLGSPTFVDMLHAYDPELRGLARDAAQRAGEHLGEGVYAGLVGPSYETPAEVAMLRTLGADLVGMSTVVEVIAARALGLRVLGLSLVTNVHRPEGRPTDHDEVLATGRTGGPRLAAVLRSLLPSLALR
jgi:purine-nucleoside phosphorylase